MTMRTPVLLLLFGTSIIATVESDDDLKFFVELVAPRGFQVSVKNAARMESVSMWGAVYPGNSTIPLSQYTVDLDLQNGWWIYENRNARLNPNDKFRVSFIITSSKPDGRKEMNVEEKTYFVPANATRVGARVPAN